MDKILLMIFLTFSFVGSSSKPVRIVRSPHSDETSKVFKIGDHLVKLSVLNESNDQSEETTTHRHIGTEKTYVAVLNVDMAHPTVPQTTEIVDVWKPLETFGRINEKFKQLSELLNVHEGVLRSLSKKKDVISTEAGNRTVDSSLQLPANDRNFNIHILADPPIKLKTVVGYSQNDNNDGAASNGKMKIRISNKEAATPSSAIDATVGDNRDVVDEAEREYFLRKGSELLFRIWNKFKRQKLLNKEGQGFDEERVESPYT